MKQGFQFPPDRPMFDFFYDQEQYPASVQGRNRQEVHYGQIDGSRAVNWIT